MACFRVSSCRSYATRVIGATVVRTHVYALAARLFHSDRTERPCTDVVQQITDIRPQRLPLHDAIHNPIPTYDARRQNRYIYIIYMHTACSYGYGKYIYVCIRYIRYVCSHSIHIYLIHTCITYVYPHIYVCTYMYVHIYMCAYIYICI
jgi:hypothetical protein